MKDQHSEAALQAFLAALCAIPFPLVTLVLGFEYSAVDPLASSLIRDHAALIASISFVCASAAYFYLLRLRDQRAFAILGIACLLGITAATVYFGTKHHRDYFSAVFMEAPVALCLLLAWTRSRPVGVIRPEALKVMGRTGYVAFYIFIAWIMMMGYAIATRAEPRPIEAVIYNCYNFALDFALFLLSRGVVLRSRRTLMLREGGIFLDGSPVEEVLGSTEIAILRAFIEAPGGSLACAGIQGLLTQAKPGRKRSYDCLSCTPNGAKAADCPGYRRIYNSVLGIKKLLEFLEIGTIVPPRNKARILSDGWRLLLFENVRVGSAEKKPSRLSPRRSSS